MNKAIISILLFLFFISIAVNIVYTPITKVDLLDRSILDSRIYVSMFEGKSLKEIPKPFRYRIFVPYFARIIPGPPSFLMWGFELDSAKLVKFRFGVVNALGLALTAWILFYYCRKFGFEPALSFIGSLLFLTSFYVINYAGIPYVDPFAYFFLMAALHTANLDMKWAYLAIFMIGIFAKETIILALIYIMFSDKTARQKVKYILLSLPGFAFYLIFRFILLPTEFGDNYTIERIQEVVGKYQNGTGPFIFAIINLVFVFGFAWLLALNGLRILMKLRERKFLSLLPVIPLILITPFLIGSDFGRIWFLSFPSIVPLILLGLNDVFKPDEP